MSVLSHCLLAGRGSCDDCIRIVRWLLAEVGSGTGLREGLPDKAVMAYVSAVPWTSRRRRPIELYARGGWYVIRRPARAASRDSGRYRRHCHGLEDQRPAACRCISGVTTANSIAMSLPAWMPAARSPARRASTRRATPNQTSAGSTFIRSRPRAPQQPSRVGPVHGPAGTSDRAAASDSGGSGFHRRRARVSHMDRFRFRRPRRQAGTV